MKAVAIRKMSECFFGLLLLPLLLDPHNYWQDPLNSFLFVGMFITPLSMDFSIFTIFH